MDVDWYWSFTRLGLGVHLSLDPNTYKQGLIVAQVSLLFLTLSLRVKRKGQEK
jgi:uncharacterized membrane protein YfhO